MESELNLEAASDVTCSVAKPYFVREVWLERDVFNTHFPGKADWETTLFESRFLNILNFA